MAARNDERNKGDNRMNFMPGVPERPFNMAVLFLERINNRCNERDVAIYQGNYIGLYNCLKAIYMNIHFKLMTDKEKGESRIKEIEELFLKVKGLLNTNKSMERVTIPAAAEILDTIFIKLNDWMYEYNMIFPKNSMSLEAEIEDDFG